MDSYRDFAAVYDCLMSDADYPGRAAFLARLFERYDRMPRLLLDLACGTGGFSFEFAKRGVEVIGVDSSADMLAVAREKAQENGENVLFLCQQAENLDLYGTVDGAICCFDSLNHITQYESFCRAISRVTLFLETGRLFLFDLNTVYKHKTVLSNHTFVIEQDGVYCVWQNETDDNTNQTNITLDFFAQENGVYVRGGEEFTERAYTESEILAAIEQAGLELLAVLDGEKQSEPTEKTERAIYVTRKIVPTASFLKEN